MTPPEVQVGDWVLLESGVPPARVADPQDALILRGYIRRNPGRLKEIRGTRNSQPWHWTREGGTSRHFVESAVASIEARGKAWRRANRPQGDGR